jgi:predicted alpha/beta-hydrolase family hydrolase
MIEPVSDGLVQGFLHSPEGFTDTAVILTHGAGSNCNTRLLLSLADAIAQRGCFALRIDLPFRQERRSGSPHPTKAARDREGLREAVRYLRRGGFANVVLGGHSYGGRQASMAAAEDPDLVNSLLLLSYPLHPPRKPRDLRTAHFASLRTPALFVHGTRDPFGTPQEMKEHLPAGAELVLGDRQSGPHSGPVAQLTTMMTDPGPGWAGLPAVRIAA